MTEYEINIKKWLNGNSVGKKSGLLPGGKVAVLDMTDEPEKFISAVKKWMDFNQVPDVEFSNDYLYVIRRILMKGFSRKFEEQYREVYEKYTCRKKY